MCVSKTTRIQWEVEKMAKQPTKREVASAEKRKRIYETGLELFREKGYQQTTILDICEATNLSVGSFYHFYDNKESILVQHLKQFRVPNTLNEVNSEDLRVPAKVLLGYLTAYLEHWDELGFSLTSLVFHISDPLYFNDREYDLRFYKVHKEFVDFIENCQKEASITTDLSPLLIAKQLFTLVYGMIYEWCLMTDRPNLSERGEAYLPRLINSYITTTK